MGKASVEFDFDKLRTLLNNIMQHSGIEVDGEQCPQFLSINYGLVEYVDWSKHRLNTDRLPNPVQYTYAKDATAYGAEKEVRISLSAFGMGNFAMNDGRVISFPPFLKLPFDFRAALATGAIKHIMISDDAPHVLEAELRRLIP